jgi:hypothetical protein
MSETKYKNVFVLCTGRSGSTTLAKACAKISNYSSGHETKASEIGEERLNYPTSHIEADNRLSWMLGKLDERFGDEPFYVHLTRDREEVVRSFGNRWNYSSSIIRFLAEGVFSLIPDLLGEKQRTVLCEDYYDIVNANILLFLKDKTNKMTMRLESLESDFEEFWHQVQAQGDLAAALSEIRTPHNAGQSKEKSQEKEKAFELELERRILNKKLVEANGFGEKLSIRIRLLATKF